MLMTKMSISSAIEAKSNQWRTRRPKTERCRAIAPAVDLVYIENQASPFDVIYRRKSARFGESAGTNYVLHRIQTKGSRPNSPVVHPGRLSNSKNVTPIRFEKRSDEFSAKMSFDYSSDWFAREDDWPFDFARFSKSSRTIGTSFVSTEEDLELVEFGVEDGEETDETDANASCFSIRDRDRWARRCSVLAAESIESVRVETERFADDCRASGPAHRDYDRLDVTFDSNDDRTNSTDRREDNLSYRRSSSPGSDRADATIGWKEYFSSHSNARFPFPRSNGRPERHFSEGRIRSAASRDDRWESANSVRILFHETSREKDLLSSVKFFDQRIIFHEQVADPWPFDQVIGQVRMKIQIALNRRAQDEKAGANVLFLQRLNNLFRVDRMGTVIEGKSDATSLRTIEKKVFPFRIFIRRENSFPPVKFHEHEDQRTLHPKGPNR